ncbi:MAG: orotate phosphoribosyltransferase [Candidatus Marinimicrobia bacterium]|nr:orotate phosphoribosyltransferase [Candidatus Neomarinimicrobiota bacterium]
MSENKFKKLLIESGAVLDGHFLLTSGLHSPTYVEKFQLLKYPKLTDKICKGIADHFKNTSPSVVLGAATGGIPISQSVGRELSNRSIFAERVDGQLTLKRGFKIEQGEKVLIVDDVVTTGGSIYELMDLVKNNDGIIMGIGVIIDRSGKKIDFGVDYHPLVKMDIPAYESENCPLCQDGIELTSRGRTGKK